MKNDLKPMLRMIRSLCFALALVNSSAQGGLGPIVQPNIASRMLIKANLIALRVDQGSLTNADFRMYAPRPPLTNADPSIRRRIWLNVPRNMKIERSPDRLAVSIDPNSCKPVKISIGSNMVFGVHSEIYTCPVGGSRPPTPWCRGHSYGLDFNLGTDIVSPHQDGFPARGKRCVVEMDFAFFETDIPSQHLWMPYGSKKYHVLLRRKLKQIVSP
jgi:hypothetical protein